MPARPPSTALAAPSGHYDLAGVEGAAGAEGAGARAWAVLVLVAVAWGAWQVSGSGVSLRAAPLMGRWQLHLGFGVLPAVILGAAVVRWGPRVTQRAPWRLVPPLAGGVAAAWTAALAASEGWSRLTEPLVTRHEYEPLAARVDGIGPFLAGYVDRLGEYPIHVQGHPPGPVVVSWLLDRVGLGGAGWLALLAIVAWGGAAACALAAARAVAGEQSARRAAPALAVLPAAVWAGTSLDALFTGLVAAALALVAHAGARARVQPPAPGGPRSGLWWAAAGGVAFGAALLCSYGVALLGLVVGVAVLATAPVPWRTAMVAAGGSAALLGLAAAAGFWWPDGLGATHQAYWAGVAAERPGMYVTLVGNPAALALATGPATAVGLAILAAHARRGHLLQPGRVRSAGRASESGRGVGSTVWPGRAALLPVAALVAVVAADLSQLSRGEVERIWLPFVPWLALAAPGNRTGWLAAQVAVALVLQSVLVSPW